jgi:Thiamine pyrophosphate enzyme, C-terminal TPP binding domain
VHNRLGFWDRNLPTLLRGEERTASLPQSRNRGNGLRASRGDRRVPRSGQAAICRYGLPIKVFVLNNQGYASIRTSQARYFQRLVESNPASGMTLPDTLADAGAYGIPGMRIAGGDDVRAKVPEALASRGPLVVDVTLPPDEPRQPPVVSAPRAGRHDGGEAA